MANQELKIPPIDELKERVFTLQDGVFCFREVEEQTSQQIEFMFQHLDMLRDGMEPWYLVVDLRNTKPPGADLRALIREKYEEMPCPPKMICLVVGKNVLIQIAVRFVAGRNFKFPYRVVADMDMAMKEVEIHQR